MRVPSKSNNMTETPPLSNFMSFRAGLGVLGVSTNLYWDVHDCGEARPKLNEIWRGPRASFCEDTPAPGDRAASGKDSGPLRAGGLKSKVGDDRLVEGVAKFSGRTRCFWTPVPGLSRISVGETVLGKSKLGDGLLLLVLAEEGVVVMRRDGNHGRRPPVVSDAAASPIGDRRASMGVDAFGEPLPQIDEPQMGAKSTES